eukprot:scaffold5398_cov120-Cylindrotheca_fusiformis.AAC.4
MKSFQLLFLVVFALIANSFAVEHERVLATVKSTKAPTTKSTKAPTATKSPKATKAPTVKGSKRALLRNIQ